MAYRLTGDEKYSDWHRKIHDWTYKFFPDPEYGEWYGYLHRDGRIYALIYMRLSVGFLMLDRCPYPFRSIHYHMNKNYSGLLD